MTNPHNLFTRTLRKEMEAFLDLHAEVPEICVEFLTQNRDNQSRGLRDFLLEKLDVVKEKCIEQKNYAPIAECCLEQYHHVDYIGMSYYGPINTSKGKNPQRIQYGQWAYKRAKKSLTKGEFDEALELLKVQQIVNENIGGMPNSYDFEACSDHTEYLEKNILKQKKAFRAVARLTR